MIKKFSRLSIRERIVDNEHRYAIFIAPYGKKMHKPLVLTVPPLGTWITPEEKLLVARCIEAEIPIIINFATLDEAVHILRWLDKERETAEKADSAAAE